MAGGGLGVFSDRAGRGTIAVIGGGPFDDLGARALRFPGGGWPRDDDQRVGALVVALDIDDDDGDVVAATPGVGQRDQFLGRLARVRKAGQDGGDLVIRGFARQAVAAEQVPVVVLGGDLDHVHVDGRLDAERPGQDVTLRVDRGLRLADLTVVDKFLDQAVVHSDLHERLVSVEVDPRVADVGHGQPARPVLVFDDRQCHQRGAHAEHAAVGPGLLPDGAVGRLGRALQRGGRTLVARFEGGVQGFYGCERGDLAGGVTAHPICHCVQARCDQELVLVVGADEANVRGRANHQPRHLRSSSTVRPT